MKKNADSRGQKALGLGGYRRGKKNSTVALIPAAILSRTPVTLDSVPQIQDVYNLMDILEAMNVHSTFEDCVLHIDPTQIKEVPLPEGKIKSLRASYYFMGALLGRFGSANVACQVGMTSARVRSINISRALKPSALP